MTNQLDAHESFKLLDDAMMAVNSACLKVGEKMGGGFAWGELLDAKKRAATACGCEKECRLYREPLTIGAGVDR